MSDATILAGALEIEQALAFVYGAGLSSPSAAVRGVAQPFVAHEQEHVKRLNAKLEAIGGRKVPAAGTAALDALSHRLRLPSAFSALRAPDDVLRFLLALERAGVERWQAAHRRLEDIELLQTATEVMACQAQHVVALRAALHEHVLP